MPKSRSWGPDGIFNSSNDQAWVKVLDFAGGAVVVINVGIAGLMCGFMLGKRSDETQQRNVVFTFLGTALLWVVWLGFNSGSAVSAGVQTGMAMAVTQIATAITALTWMFIEWAHRGKPTVTGICSGAVAGLVAITPACGFIGPLGSMITGVVTGVLCYFGVAGIKAGLGSNEVRNWFATLTISGVIGTLLTGVFAIQQYGGTAGLLEGNPGQVINQLIGVATVIIYDVLISLLILKVIDVVIGLRLDNLTNLASSDAVGELAAASNRSRSEPSRPA